MQLLWCQIQLRVEASLADIMQHLVDMRSPLHPGRAYVGAQSHTKGMYAHDGARARVIGDAHKAVAIRRCPCPRGKGLGIDDAVGLILNVEELGSIERYASTIRLCITVDRAGNVFAMRLCRIPR